MLSYLFDHTASPMAEVTSHLSSKENRELIRLLAHLVEGNGQNRPTI
ncbi:hypothetical protein [Cryobacterium sp. Y29]|nr:hypothetical protein [Cryobacterium sp. Y29]